MKGVGIETRRCANCQNLQEVIAVDGTITVFFRCDACNSGTYLQNRIDKFTIGNLFENIRCIDTT